MRGVRLRGVRLKKNALKYCPLLDSLLYILVFILTPKFAD
jgi:hypothetical protein